MAEYGSSTYGITPYGGPAASGTPGGGGGTLAPTIVLKPTVPRLVDPWLPPPYEIRNLLTEDQQTFTGVASTTDVSGWVVGGGATIARSTRYQKFDPASLEVTVDDPALAWVHTVGWVSVAPGHRYRAFGWVRTERIRHVVRLGIEWADSTSIDVPVTTAWGEVLYARTENGTAITGSDVTFVEEAISGNRGWTLLSVEVEAPSLGRGYGFDAVGARLRVELPESAATERLWIDDVVLTDYVEPRSGITRLASRWVPEYLLMLDAEAQAPQWPMLRYFDLIGATANRMLRASLAFDYVPGVDDYPGFERATLVDARFYPAPDYAEERWLPWLAFLTGCQTIAIRVGGTGSYTPWDLLDGTRTNTLVSWDAWPSTWDTLEGYAPEAPLQLIADADAIRTQGTGVYAGTVEGIRRAARLALDSKYFDRPATFLQTDVDEVTATFAGPVTFHGSGVGQVLDVYGTGNTVLDGQVEVTSIAADSRSIVFTVAGIDLPAEVDGYVTERVVRVTTGYGASIWGLLVETELVATPNLTMLERVVALAKPAGCTVTYQYTTF